MKGMNSVESFTGQIRDDTGVVYGSGFVVICSKSEILVATCYHVVQKSLESNSKIYFKLFSADEEIRVDISASDEVTDMALLCGVNTKSWEIQPPKLSFSETYPVDNCLVQGYMTPESYNDSRILKYSSVAGLAVGPEKRDGVEWIKLSIPNVYKGLSGSPVILKNPLRVIGIQSETYFGSELKDTSWAIKIENLVKLDDRFSSGVPNGLGLSYVKIIIRDNNKIYLPSIKERKGIPKIPLERVYIALKVRSKTSSYELNNAKKILDRKFEKILEDYGLEPDDEEALKIRAELIQKNPKLRLWSSEAESSKSEDNVDKVINIGEAFKYHRYLVILGDPGSGKTTLAKWIAVKLAKTYIDERELGIKQRVIVKKSKIDINDLNTEEIEDLGPSRIPILIKISEYARFFENQSVDKRGLDNYLGYFIKIPGFNFKEIESYFKNELSLGNCVVILDGMDEVTRFRTDILREIENFIDIWINGRGNIEESRWDPLSLYESPVQVGGNQLIVTSRVVGYHSAPLSGDLTHVTIERMDEKAVRHFCDIWTEQIYFSEFHNISKEEIIALAKDEAEALKDAIFDDSKPLVRDLATNPLLVTILALVFRHQNRKLPQSRAELYDRALNVLLIKWRENLKISQNEIRLILAPLAAEIHGSSTDDIKEQDLVSIVKENLAIVRNVQIRNELISCFDEEVKDFLKNIREDIGIITERANNIYHFLHRTFQEYLAGQFLIGCNPRLQNEEIVEISCHNILNKISDPVWREPVILSLGAVDLSWSTEKANELIKSILDADDPLEDLVPRNSLFVANALSEMGGLESGIVENIIFKLLSNYSDRLKLKRSKDLRTYIENILKQLYKGERKKILKDVFSDIILNEYPKKLKLATLFLIKKNEWVESSWIKHIAAIKDIDSSSWNWPIERILRDHFSKEKTSNNVTLLKFKSTLESRGDIYNELLSSEKWIRVTTCLFGGWVSSELANTFVKFEMYNWSLNTKKGTDKERYDMAVSLDTEYGQLKPLFQNFPLFSVEYIYKESIFSRYILRSLSKKQDINTFINATKNKFWNSSTDQEKYESLLILFCLGCKIDNTFFDRENISIETFKSKLEIVAKGLENPLIQFLSYCDKIKEKNDFFSFIENLDDENKKLIINKIIHVQNKLRLPNWQISYNVKEKRLFEVDESKVSNDLKKFLNAEFLTNLTSGKSSDPVYNTAVSLDTIPKVIKGDDVEFFLDTILSIPNSLSHQNPIRYKWELPKYLIKFDQIERKLIQAFEIIGGIPSEYSFLKSWLLNTLDSLYPSNVELRLSAYLFCYGLSEPKDEIGQNKHLESLKFEGDNLQLDILLKIKSIRDPFLRCICCIKYLQLEPDNDIKFTAFESYGSILNYSELLYASMYMFDILSNEENTGMLKVYLQDSDKEFIASLQWLVVGRIYDLVDKIDLIENKISASIFIAKLSENGGEEHLRNIIELIPKVKDESTRVIYLNKVLVEFPSLIDYDCKKKIADSFTSETYKNSILGDENCTFNKLDIIVSSNFADGNFVQHFWPIFSLYCSIDSFVGNSTLQENKDNSEMDFWDCLVKGDIDSKALNIFLAKSVNGIKITPKIANSINSLIDDENEEYLLALLPFLESPTTASWAIIENWKKSELRTIRNFFHLLKAESGVFLDHTIISLIEFLKSPIDRLRCRASISIHGPIQDAGNEDRLIHTSQLGFEILISIYEKKNSLKSYFPAVFQTVGWINLNLSHNDPKIIEEIVKRILSSAVGSEESDFYIGIFEDISYITPRAWVQFITYLNFDDARVVKATLKVITKLCNIGGKYRTHWPSYAWGQVVDCMTRGHLEFLNSMNFRHYTIDNILSVLGSIDKNESLDAGIQAGQCNDAFDKICSIDFSDSLLDSNDKYSYKGKLFKKMALAGKSQFIQPDSLLKEASDGAKKVKENPHWLPTLFHWTFETLNDELIDMNFSYKGGKIAMLASEVAKLYPDTYSNIIDHSYASSVLNETVRCHVSWVARQGAIVLIACLNEISPESLESLKFAMKDVDHVQEQAVSSYKFFKNFVDESSLNSIIENVREGNGIHSYVLVKILTEIAISNHHDRVLRVRAVETLANYIRGNSIISYPKKFVYHLDTTLPAINLKPKYLGKLDDLYYGELMKIIGL